MTTTSTIFEKMRSTEMNDWVGGSDPEAVGDASADIIRRLLPLTPDSHVLDFGCGIGRGMVSLLKSEPRPAALVGMDIMPPVIQFCKDNIALHFDNVNFELIEGSNDHYDQFIGSDERKSVYTITSSYASRFSAAYAFSVFTHVDKKDFVDLLKLIYAVMAPGGYFLFTCFTLTDFSRAMIEQRQSLFPFLNAAFVDDGNILWGDRSDPLAFIAYDKHLLEAMTWESGFALMKVEYGVWMGGNLGSSLHDLVVVRKPMPLVSSDQIVFTPLVDRNNLEKN